MARAVRAGSLSLQLGGPSKVSKLGDPPTRPGIFILVQQRTSYDALKEALARRFKPVRIKSVKSGLFHERKQKPQESVEEYAQDLNKLYQQAYPQSEKGSEEAEKMGKTVLAYQFAAGLKPEIRLKVTGTEGSFEQLRMRARFEEAKLRDLQFITLN